MNRSAEYQTRQKGIVEAAFRATAGEHITVAELTRRLEEQGNAVGRTTVYRTLERLVRDGKARKFSAVQGDSVCYQAIGETACREHFHLKCSACGKLLHMDCSLMDRLSRHIEEEHGFQVDPLNTVLYGICEDCRKK